MGATLDKSFQDGCQSLRPPRAPAFRAISDLFGPLINKHNTEHHYEHDILHACQGSHSKIIVFSKVIKLFVDSRSAPWPHNALISPIDIYFQMCAYIQME